MARGAASPSDFWHEMCPDIQYQTVVRYFWILKQLGLVMEIGEVPSSKRGPIPKKLYAIVPGRENDPCWAAPQNCLALLRGWVVIDPRTGAIIPKTKLGSKRYRRYVTHG